MIALLWLGNNQASNTIYSGGNNMGKFDIGTIVKDVKSQVLDKKFQFQVNVKRLDSITKIDSPQDVKLMNMGVKGSYNCRILKGFGQDIVNNIEMIKFEYATHWLDGQDCTDLALNLVNYGLTAFRNNVSGLKFTRSMLDNPSLLTTINQPVGMNEVLEKELITYIQINKYFSTYQI